MLSRNQLTVIGFAAVAGLCGVLACVEIQSAAQPHGDGGVGIPTRGFDYGDNSGDGGSSDNSGNDNSGDDNSGNDNTAADNSSEDNANDNTAPPDGDFPFEDVVTNGGEAIPALPEGAEFVETASGLRAATIREGDGRIAEQGHITTVTYEAWILPGEEVFDQTYEFAVPEVFLLGRGSLPNGETVIGVSEGIGGNPIESEGSSTLPAMKVGGIRRLYVPAIIGYGDARRPPFMTPEDTLVYDIELIDVDETAYGPFDETPLDEPGTFPGG